MFVVSLFVLIGLIYTADATPGTTSPILNPDHVTLESLAETGADDNHHHRHHIVHH